MEEGCHSANRIGAPAEAKKKNAISGLPQAYESSVAVDDVACNAKASGLCYRVVDSSQQASHEMPAIGL